MCEPTTIMTGLALATSAAGAVGQYQSANAQVDAANAQAAAQAEEIKARQDQQAGERIRAARREAARARVAAGEAGVAGQSFEAQLADTFGRANQDLAILSKQGGFTERAVNANLKSNTAGTQRAGGLGAALQIASSGAQGYATGLQIKNS